MSDMRQPRSMRRVFADAMRGIRVATRSERNLRIHFCIVIVVVVLGFFLNVSGWEWVALVFCIGIVLVAEMINSAVESLADTTHPEKHPGIRDTKDIAAGAVLIAVLAAVVVGVIIFLPKLWELGKQLLMQTGSPT